MESNVKSKISIIIPTYNRPEMVEKAVKSVLNQTYNDFQIIVINDGSEKSPDSIIERLNDERIIYLKHNKNKGGGAARNTGIKNSNSEYITFLDDDDEYLPDKLECQIMIMEKYKNDIDYMFCAVTNYYEKTGRIETQRFQNKGINDYHNDVLAHNIRMLTPALFVKSNVIKSLNGFDERFPSNQEWDLTIRLTKNRKGYCLDKSLIKVNILKGEHTGGSLSRRIAGRELIVEKYFDELIKNSLIISKHYFQLGIFCRDNNSFKKARKYLFLAWRYDKLNFRMPGHLFFVLFGKKVYDQLRKIY